MSQSAALLDALTPHEQFVIVMHDNPDPDSIATGWAIATLIDERLQKPSRLIAGGAILRAENRHMVELLKPPIQLVITLDVADAAAILVDCGVGAQNQLLTREDVSPVAVIDHHQDGVHPPGMPFVDIRETAAASASIAASYLREQDIEPSPQLATALLYALRTETFACETHYSPLDQSIFVWLTERADPAMLAEIESAPLARAWYSDLVLAMQGAKIYGDTAFRLLPRAGGSEIVGEMADLLIRCEGVQRVLCGAAVGADLLVSARTQYDDGNAAELLQQTLAGLGSSGGHTHRAGGKIPAAADDGKIDPKTRDDLLRRWLKACDVADEEGEYLIARNEIIENL